MGFSSRSIVTGTAHSCHLLAATTIGFPEPFLSLLRPSHYEEIGPSAWQSKREFFFFSKEQ
jgi:hypothetical protein